MRIRLTLLALFILLLGGVCWLWWQSHRERGWWLLQSAATVEATEPELEAKAALGLENHRGRLILIRTVAEHMPDEGVLRLDEPRALEWQYGTHTPADGMVTMRGSSLRTSPEWAVRPGSARRVAGVIWSDTGWKLPPMQGVFRYRIRELVLPHWMLAGALSLPILLVGLSFIPVMRRRARLAAGCCPACGYDLRESPAQCPECGRPSATVA